MGNALLVRPFLLEASPNKYELLELMRRAHARAPGWVVEVGCGGGWYTGHLCDGGCKHRTVGLDAAALGVHLAAMRYPGSRFAQADAQHIPFRDGQVSFLLCSEVLEHVPDDRRAAAEIARVLAPGGIAVLTVPNRDQRWGWRFSVRNRRVGHLRLYTMAELRRIFEPGLEVVEARFINHLYDVVFHALVLTPFAWIFVKGPRSAGHVHPTHFVVERPMRLRGPLAVMARGAYAFFRALYRADLRWMSGMKTGNNLLLVLRKPHGADRP